jgi:hypothetical protein
MTKPSTPPEEEPSDEEAREHLQNVKDGCGCTEIWEHLSEDRRQND